MKSFFVVFNVVLKLRLLIFRYFIAILSFNRDIDSPFGLSGRLKDHVSEETVTGMKKKDPIRTCRVCSSKGNHSGTRYICKTCCVPLHVGDCCTLYHAKEITQI